MTLTPVKVTSSAVTVTLKAGAGSNYSAADDKTISVTVASGTLSVSVSDKTATYNGSAISPNTVTVTEPANGATVKYGTAA